MITGSDKRTPESVEITHEHAGSDKDQKQAGDETVDTGGLCDRAAQKHGAGDVALALGLTADGLQSLRGSVAFTDTRADTCDQSASRADAAASQCDYCFRAVYCFSAVYCFPAAYDFLQFAVFLPFCDLKPDSLPSETVSETAARSFPDQPSAAFAMYMIVSIVKIKACIHPVNQSK